MTTRITLPILTWPQIAAALGLPPKPPPEKTDSATASEAEEASAKPPKGIQPIATQIQHCLQTFSRLDKVIVEWYLDFTSGYTPGQPGIPGPMYNNFAKPEHYRTEADRPAPDRLLPVKDYQRYQETMDRLFEQRRSTLRQLSAHIAAAAIALDQDPEGLAHLTDSVEHGYRVDPVIARPQLAASPLENMPDILDYYDLIETQYQAIHYAASHLPG